MQKDRSWQSFIRFVVCAAVFALLIGIVPTAARNAAASGFADGATGAATDGSVAPGVSEVTAQAVVSESLKKPELISLKLFDDGAADKAVLQWKSTKNLEYRVLRKVPGGKWKTIGGVKASGTTARFTDKGLDPAQTYIYTVRSRAKKNGAYVYSKHDAGITTIPGMIQVSIKPENLSTRISWNSMENSTVKGVKYTVYRSFEDDPTQRSIAKLKDTSFTDVYHDTFNEEERSRYMRKDNVYMIDPSNNPIRYAVRPWKKYSSGKVSYGKYARDGVFKLSMPVITDLLIWESEADITWGRVPFAQEYLVYIGKKTDDGMKWVKKATVPASDSEFLTATVPAVSGYPYVTVKAKANCQGKTISSPIDTGFRRDLQKYADTNVLFIGDSIFWGSVYTNHVEYSIPYRVKNLLGAYIYNASIPGGTYTRNAREGHTILTDCLDRVIAGEPTIGKTYTRNQKSTPKKLSEYDVIVLGGGTNDFGHSVGLGNYDDSDLDTFHGALNILCDDIRQANEIRLENGREPVKVIYLKLFFRYRIGHYDVLNSSDTYVNLAGLTLQDYSDAIRQHMQDLDGEGIAAYYINTDDFVNAKNCLTASFDNIHLTRVTYAKIGNTIANKIRTALK